MSKTYKMPLKEIVQAFGFKNVKDMPWGGVDSREWLVASDGRAFEIEVTVAWKCTGCGSYHTGDCASM
jgi:hypothetical protein